MDAMGFGRFKHHLARLWQLPLLLFSLGLFGYAAILFIDPKGGPTVSERLGAAAALLKQERPDAAIEQLDALLDSKLGKAQEGAARMLLAAAMDLSQTQRHLSIPETHRQIIENTKLAISLGIAPDAAAYRRMAACNESIEKPDDAIFDYKQAASLDAEHALLWQRKVIELQLRQVNVDAASASLAEYLKHPDLTDSERAWALGEQAHVLVDRGQFAEARQLLGEVLKLESQDRADRGQFNYWLGYCAWKLNQSDEAERYLRVARDQLRVQHPLDGDAANLLGKIRQDKKDYSGAAAFYASVLQGHLDAPVAQLAKAGRGVCRIALGSEDAGLSDLSDLVKRLREREFGPKELRDATYVALKQAGEMLSASGNYQGALEVMAYEQEMEPKPSAEFFARLGKVYERRAMQLEAALPDAKASERADRQEQIAKLRTEAGNALIANSRALTLVDDKGYGAALWRGIELYEAAGDLPNVISALKTFVEERPNDSQAPDALLRLGNAYQAAGLFDRAIEAYRKAQFRYSRSLAASASGVPLARAYIAKGPEFYGNAEEVLKQIVEDNPQITPEAREFQESLLELAKLYYSTGRYEQAIARAEEMGQRYPRDERMGQLYFLMADSYRKSAARLEEKARSTTRPSTTQPAADLAEIAQARTERLARARDLFKQTIDYYKTANPAGDLDKLYMKLSYFYRADCVYDMGQYLEAIRLFDDAAFRYQEDPSALAAYVQIVNANVALGRIEEAKAANERAKWMLRRMPPEVFADSSNFAMSRPAWEQWLRWASASGLWK